MQLKMESPGEFSGLVGEVYSEQVERFQSGEELLEFLRRTQAHQTEYSLQATTGRKGSGISEESAASPARSLRGAADITG